MIRLSIMQPYFLPYIGYFQLIAASDRFVVLDDVHYINRGWINRNRLLSNGNPQRFTIPLRHASQNKLICDLEIDDSQAWRAKLLRTISICYRKAPYFEETRELIERIIQFPSRHLTEFLLHSIMAVVAHLSLKTEIIPTSRAYQNSHLSGEARIIDICIKENATVYINAANGISLYQPESFARNGLSLKFIRSRLTHYTQNTTPHVPWLSMLDVLMFNDRNMARQLLGEVDFS